MSGLERWDNRIVSHGVKPASQFTANPLNFRKHPMKQRAAVTATLSELGWIGPVIVNRRTGYLVDGHERVMNAMQHGDQDVPFVEVELTESEEAKALATFDPIGDMAEVDSEALDRLLREVQTGEPALQELFADMAKDANLYEVGGEENEEDDWSPDRLFPVAILLTRPQLTAWERRKKERGLKDDTRVFVEALGLEAGNDVEET